MIPGKALSPGIPAVRLSVFNNLDCEPPPPVADIFFLCVQMIFGLCFNINPLSYDLGQGSRNGILSLSLSLLPRLLICLSQY